MLPCGPDPRKCSSHRGYPLFNGARAALRSVQRACDRERSRPDAKDDIVADRELLMSEARPRRVQGDAETLRHFGRERNVELEGEDGSGSEVRTRTGSATLCCVGLAPFTRC